MSHQIYRDITTFYRFESTQNISLLLLLVLLLLMLLLMLMVMLLLYYTCEFRRTEGWLCVLFVLRIYFLRRHIKIVVFLLLLLLCQRIESYFLPSSLPWRCECARDSARDLRERDFRLDGCIDRFEACCWLASSSSDAGPSFPVHICTRVHSIR